VLARVRIQSHDLVSQNAELAATFLIHDSVTDDDNCQFSTVPITFTSNDFTIELDRNGIRTIRSQFVEAEDRNFVRQHDDSAIGLGHPNFHPRREAIIDPTRRYTFEIRHEHQAAMPRPAARNAPPPRGRATTRPTAIPGQNSVGDRGLQHRIERSPNLLQDHFG
jgi:hypothetical protein